MKILIKLIIILAFIFPAIIFAEKPSSGEVDCERPVGDSAKRTCEDCGYVYDGSGKVTKRPDFENLNDKSKGDTATGK